MRLLGKIGNTEVVILVDLENTHNFLDRSIVTKNYLSLDEAGQLKVKVADGESLTEYGHLSQCDHNNTRYSFLPLLLCVILSWLSCRIRNTMADSTRAFTWDFSSLNINF